MAEIIRVRLGEVAVARAPDVLVTYALGSCVACCLYDGMEKIGALGHIMLPISTNLPQGLRPGTRFADVAMTAMLEGLERLGAREERLYAKLFGGACMFPNLNEGGLMNVGEKNVLAIREILYKHKIRIEAEDTFKNYGRSVEFYLESGIVLVKTAFSGETRH